MKRALVAMSGGIDSSVTAALLKRAGFLVEGVFFRLGDLKKFKESEKRAKKVAKTLNIHLRVLDLRKEFKKNIIDYFLREYKAGRTPNPCVVCNPQIKFKSLFSLKSDSVATGHYARVNKGKLFKAKDKEKDQSYFLWLLKQKELERILFPLGGYTKKEVKTLVKKFKLPVLSAGESQEVCFIEKTTNEFLSKHIKQKPGLIVDQKGKVLDKHQGLFLYTIGQRKGIGLSGGPYWVVKKDLKKNLLIVSRDEKDLLEKQVVFKSVNWFSGRPPKLNTNLKAKIRYRSKLVSGRLTKRNKFVFNRPQRAITPGQSIVFYKSNELLGGAIID